MIEFGVCPDGDACTAADCDGTDLGHTLAAEFPEETARVVEALAPVEEWLRAELRLGLNLAMGTPLSAVDGRPWVPTHDEAHPPFLWGNGTGMDGAAGCGHDDCDANRGDTT